MRSADEHLTPLELQFLLFAGADEDVPGDGGMAAPEARQHLDGCAICQATAQKYVDADSLLRTFDVPPPDRSRSRGPDCPPDETWLRMAAGLIDDAAAAPYVSHAARCDWCGPLLKESMEDLAQPVDVEEEAALGRLQSSTPAWQRELGKKLAAAAAVDSSRAAGGPAQKKSPLKEEKRKFGWWPRFAAAAASVLVAIGGWQVWEHTRLPYAERLLAQAYTEHRTIELRMPGAKYGRMRVERGDSALKMPVQFDEAQVIIKRESKKHPDDPDWLQAEARAALLEGNYKEAINTLDHALVLKPGDPEILVDKATALFQRAEKEGSQARIDYGEAAEDLSLVLAKRPDDQVALFNRAIVFERMQSLNEANADLDHYLRIDPWGPWAKEAADLRDRLKALMKTRSDKSSRPLAGPGAFLRLLGDPASVAQIDERIEDYQELALKEWLPQAFPASNRAGYNGETFSALRALADLLEELHKDSWLHALLNEANHTPIFAEAVSELTEAVERSALGDPSGSFDFARKSSQSFVKAGSPAGALRAQLEEVYSMQRSQHGDRCLALAERVEAALRGLRYAWIKEQLEIDQSSCSIMLGNFDQAHLYITKAESNVSDSGYRNLKSRALGIDAAHDTDAGNLPAAWTTDQDGLAGYWNDYSLSPIRAHQFYSDLAYNAEDLKWWHLALSLEKEAARSIADTTDLSSQAMTRSHLVRAALRASHFDLAGVELQKSSELFATLPDTEATETYRLDAEIQLAETELGMGDVARAQQDLVSLQPAVDSIASFTVPLTFYKTYGAVLERQSRLDEAEEMLAKAMHIADSNLRQLQNPSNRLLWSQDVAEIYRAVVRLELARGNSETALAAWEWYRSAQLRSGDTTAKRLDLPSSTESLRSVLSTLTTQTVVSYALTIEGLAVWAFDDRGIRSRVIPMDPAMLAGLAGRFSDMCADRESDLPTLKLAARTLYDLLLAPLQDRLSPDRTLVIEPDDTLGNVPFQVLITPDGHYLGESYRIVYSPGFAYESHLRQASPIRSDARALVVSSSAVLAGFETARVPNGPAEAAMVGRNFSRARVLADIDPKTLDAQLQDTDLFHFVGHAVSTNRLEGLVLPAHSGDGREAVLWEGPRFQDGFCRHCKLVVLAACSTGRSSTRRMENHGALVRSILISRVPSVVATFWDVDSLATSEFMKVFYARLVGGASVSVSLNSAAAQMRQLPEFGHPYYWAAFVAFGKDSETLNVL